MTPEPGAEIRDENLGENHCVNLQMLGRCTYVDVTGVFSAGHADA